MAARLSYILLSVGIGIICTATLFHIIGMSSPEWAEYRTWKDEFRIRGEFGLFELCNNDNEDRLMICKDMHFEDISMKAQVAQLFSFLALVTGVTSGGAAIVLLLILYMSRTVSRRTIISSVAVSAIGSIASSIFTLTTVGIFKERLYYDSQSRRQDLGGPVYLCGVAGVLFFAAFVVMIVAGKFIQPTPSSDNGDNQEKGSTTFGMETCDPKESSDVRSDNEV